MSFESNAISKRLDAAIATFEQNTEKLNSEQALLAQETANALKSFKSVIADLTKKLI